jgi:hypothetical protein
MGFCIPFQLPADKPRRKIAAKQDLMSEHQIHVAVVEQINKRGVKGMVFWHTANEGKHKPQYRSKLKTLGVRNGVADLVFLHRGHFYSLELKAAKGRPTYDQMQFRSDIEAAGGSTCICQGLNAAIRVLEVWGLLEGKTQ